MLRQKRIEWRWPRPPRCLDRQRVLWVGSPYTLASRPTDSHSHHSTPVFKKHTHTETHKSGQGKTTTPVTMRSMRTMSVMGWMWVGPIQLGMQN